MSQKYIWLFLSITIVCSAFREALTCSSKSAQALYSISIADEYLPCRQ